MNLQKPDWLKIRIQASDKKNDINDILKRLSLNTVCIESACPNLNECFGKNTAAFMILGNICTRNCGFCKVEKGIPKKINKNEPENIARAVKELDLTHIVITSVTRDDLEDGGAKQFAEVISHLKDLNKKITIEVLIPDFKANLNSLKRIIDTEPDVINHNIETVPRLYPEVRPEADYSRSINVIKNIKTFNPGIYSKSGIMVGLGETEYEVISVIKDLHTAGCDLLTIGQYLAPSKVHCKVVEYIHPDKFEMYKNTALALGIKFVSSGPLVRSSYNAKEFFENINQ